ncbi:ATP-dependent RNA helicase DDX60, partial [Lecanoromycetidae sp. Uapishka_2]
MDSVHTVESQVSKGDVTQIIEDDLRSVDPDNLCEGIARAVVSQLEAAELRYKETNPAWKAKISGFEQYKKDQLKAKKPTKAVSKKKGKGDDDDDPTSKLDKMQDSAGDDVNPYANFDPEAPVDGYHFAARQKAEVSELSRFFWQMNKRGLATWLTDALKRGIGVHHAGMNRKYRQVVEMLFRKGYLRVVIATGTLALGINMPCATVVFSGDSIFLTALNFRQAAGRAGRRGFDLLGNVVFQNISHGKICRLLSSRLPDLNGHFPITTTLVLRLFSLLHESGDSPYAVQAINSLLSQPRLYLDGPAFKDQVLHHLRFSIEYLRRQNLLSAQGAPINFAGLTSHLYFTENSSFALNALIKGEYFHELCSEFQDKESHVLRTLMVVMAHLFGRRPCREADAEYVENIVKRSPSIVFLPPLPPQAAAILRNHNRDTLQVFTTVKAGGADENIHLSGSLPPTKIRSAFVALSGHGDEFESISDLCRTTRGGVFLEEAVIPHLDVYPDESKTPLNAYLYDFFMHGDIEALEKANGVKKSDVWFLLNDFSLVLATITASLANFLKLPESDLSLLDITGEGDEHNNAEDDQFADSTTDTESTAGSTATTSTGKTSVTSASSLASKPVAKKKVVDSWDASDEDEDIEPEANGTGGDDPSKEELERGFLNVYKAIKKLRFEFDTKFRKIFA